MRAILTPLSLLTATMLGAAVRPATAQQADSEPRYAAPVGEPAAAPARAAVRTVANYRFVAPREPGLPAEVTLADSAGKLVASFRLPGSRDVRPMTVTAVDSDLVLQGKTPWGPITLHLYRENGADASEPLSGRWRVGSQEGDLRGRTER